MICQNWVTQTHRITDFGEKEAFFRHFECTGIFMYLKILEILSVESKGLSMGFSPIYSLPRLFPTVREQNGFEIQEKLLNQHFLDIFKGVQSNFEL